MNTKPVILIIDDEIQIRRLLELTLEANGYAIRFALNGEEGIMKAATERPEIIILDLGLPDMEGIQVLQKIREWSSLPILVVSVRSEETDIIACLDAGADDYLVKPFRTGELLARVRTALRHQPAAHENELFVFHNLSVNLAARLIKRNDEIIKLTATEYSLLALFVRNAGRVLTHRYILEQIWGPNFAEEAQYTRVYVAQLRKKIEDDPSQPKIIVTESGIGYRLNIEDM